MEKVRASIDGSPFGVVDAYSTGRTWNGWDVVYLDKESLIKWLTWCKCDYICVDPDGTVTADCDGERTEYIPSFVMLGNPWLYSMAGFCFSVIAESTC